MRPAPETIALRVSRGWHGRRVRAHQGGGSDPSSDLVNTRVGSAYDRQMPTLLISACLLGEPVRYDGSAAPLDPEAMARLREKARLVPFCPELAAGMSVPRNPAEICGGDGHDVLDGRARVLECTLADVTETFVRGAQATLDMAHECGAAMAVLKEASPSCGSSVISDGSFSSVVGPGIGVTAALLSRNGIPVYSEVTLAEAEEHLRA